MNETLAPIADASGRSTDTARARWVVVDARQMPIRRASVEKDFCLEYVDRQFRTHETLEMTHAKEQVIQAALAPRDVRLPGQDLTLDETLRVMDVARALRDRRQTAEEMFRREDIRRELREKLLRTAQLSGDNVTAAEIDAAIEQYLARLHTYQDPEGGLKSFFAHCWVWRTRILAGLIAALVATSSFWFLMASPIAPLSPTLRQERAVAAEVDLASQHLQRIEALTDDAEVLQTARSLRDEVHATEDVTTAIAARTRLEQIASQLAAEYEIHVVSGTNEMSGLERGFEDRPSMYYLIVEARTPSGEVVPQTIRNSETGQTETVRRWAVQISEAAYRRLGSDKQQDGVLNETLYGAKQRGEMEPTATLPGAISDSPSTLTRWN